MRGVTESGCSGEAGSREFCALSERFEHALDPKRRVTLPKVWRDRLGPENAAYVMPDMLEKCLRILPTEEWHRRAGKVREKALTDRYARQFARLLGRSSQRIEWDAQGRTRIRDELLRFAGLEDTVIMIGTLDSLELWAPGTEGAETEIDQERLREAAEHVEF